MANGKNPPGKANGVSPGTDLAGHKPGPGVYTSSLEGHGPGNWSVGKSTFPGGLASNGSKTTSGNPARFALGNVPD